MKNRFEIAADLRTIARLIEIKGENRFRALAFVRGGAALESLQDDLDALVKQQRLKDIPGIGNALASIIEEIHRSGECWMLQQLRDELPPGAIELSEVPGLNLKKIVALHDALRIESVNDLKTACMEGLVSKVKGFGLKSQAKLLVDIEKLQNREGKFLLLHEAAEQAESLLRHLRARPEVTQAEIGGALRRRQEIIREISVVVGSKKPKAVLDRFLCFPTLTQTEELTATHCRAQMANGFKVEITIVPPDEYVSELHARTGSPKHIAKLEALSHSKIVGGGRGIELDVENEDEIYQRLGLQPIPAELREDEGEIEAAISGTLPRPLQLENIRGMTHCHTVYSDGKDTIEEMALAAQAMGMSYLTITDHSQTAYYARGVKIDRLRAQWDEIDRVQERVTIKLLKGTEADILEDGSLDYPDHVLNQLDIVIASIHARHRMDSDQMTKRLLRALRLPIFKIWGHPLGRLIRSRPPLACHMEAVLDAIAGSRCAIEVNGDPHRLDLEPHWIRQASQRGIKFIVSTDAHSLGGFRNLTFGVSMARRGWLTREQVLNTLEVEDFMRAVHP